MMDRSVPPFCCICTTFPVQQSSVFTLMIMNRYLIDTNSPVRRVRVVLVCAVKNMSTQSKNYKICMRVCVYMCECIGFN